jgi:peroxiredoxin
MTTILAGHAAPTIRLSDTHGKTVSLAECLKKGPVVAAFFKVSCPVCQYTFPFLERLHKAYDDERVSFLAISQDEAEETLEFLSEYGVTFPALIEHASYAVSNAYGLTNVPTIFLIGTDGKVVIGGTGFDKANLEKISAALGKHLGKPPAPIFRSEENVPDYKPG